MKEVKDNLGLRTVMSDSIDIRFPHIHSYGLNGGFLPRSHSGKEVVQSLLIAMLAHPDHSAGKIIQDHRHIVMALEKGNFVKSQDLQPLIIIVGKFLLQKSQIYAFNCFGIKIQVFGNKILLLQCFLKL